MTEPYYADQRAKLYRMRADVARTRIATAASLHASAHTQDALPLWRPRRIMYRG